MSNSQFSLSKIYLVVSLCVLVCLCREINACFLLVFLIMLLRFLSLNSSFIFSTS
jgi:hypothetical protein